MQRKSMILMLLLLFGMIAVLPAVVFSQHEESEAVIHGEAATYEEGVITEADTVEAEVSEGTEETEEVTHESAVHTPAAHGSETVESHGTEEHGDGHGSTPWYRSFDLWKFINLGVLILILYKLLGAPLGKFFRDRSTSIEEMLKSAENERELARKDLETMQQNIADARAEINSILERGEVSAQRAIKEIEENTASEIEIIKRRTSDELEQELISIRQELVTFVAKEAVAQATQKIEKMNLGNLQAGYLKQFQKTLNVQGGNGEKP